MGRIIIPGFYCRQTNGIGSKIRKLWYSIYMTKLQTVISKFEALPIEQQDKLAEFLNDLTLPLEGDFTFSDTERAEIKQLLKTDTASYTFDEVLAPFLK